MNKIIQFRRSKFTEYSKKTGGGLFFFAKSILKSEIFFLTDFGKSRFLPYHIASQIFCILFFSHPLRFEKLKLKLLNDFEI